MNRRNIMLTLTLTFLRVSFNSPAQAQGWDFGGIIGTPTVPNRAAAGNPGDQNLTQGYPYVGPGVSNPMTPQGTYEATYAPNPIAAPLGMPANGHSFPIVGMPALSNMQTQSMTGKLPKGLSGVYNGLPPTILDSFVKNAGGAAQDIYGDEGTSSYPRENSFTENHTINAGIRGINNQTLTTGHASRLPTASGNGVMMSGPRTVRVRERKRLEEEKKAEE